MQTLEVNQVVPQEKKLKIVNLFILDKSGSMASIKPTIIKGFNEQIASIKKLDEENGTESLFGLVIFDTSVNIKYLNEPMAVAELLTDTSYRPDGGTAFYDALGVAIKALEDKLGSDLSDAKVLITALTDGEENSSRQYTGSQVADLVKQFQEDYKWTFSFIGANIDVEKLAKHLNVDTSNTISFVASAAGTEDAYTSLNLARSAYYTKSLNREDTTRGFFQDKTK
jgi:hypothetical protein